MLIQLHWQNYSDLTDTEFVASERLRLLVARHARGEGLRPEGGMMCDITAVLDELERLRPDAERYRKLRAMHWTNKLLVVTGMRNVKVGSFCPSEERLDEALDELPSGPLANHVADESSYSDDPPWYGRDWRLLEDREVILPGDEYASFDTPRTWYRHDRLVGESFIRGAMQETRRRL